MNIKKIMFVTRELFGKKVQIQIPNDVFPSQEQIDYIDKNTGENCQHGWFKSVSDGEARVNEDDSDGNIHLHYRCWLPPSIKKDEVKGIVIFTHGISSQSGHSSRIDGRPLDIALVVDTFTSKGIAVYARVSTVLLVVERLRTVDNFALEDLPYLFFLSRASAGFDFDFDFDLNSLIIPTQISLLRIILYNYVRTNVRRINTATVFRKANDFMYLPGRIPVTI